MESELKMPQGERLGRQIATIVGPCRVVGVLPNPRDLDPYLLVQAGDGILYRLDAYGEMARLVVDPERVL